jgi:hypothetical protein
MRKIPFSKSHHDNSLEKCFLFTNGDFFASVPGKNIKHFQCFSAEKRLGD